DLALAVADNRKRSKAETAAAFDDLGAAIDEDDLFDHLRAVALIAVVSIVTALAAGAAAVWTAAVRTTIELTGLARRNGRGCGRSGCFNNSLSGGRGSGFGAHAVF